MKYASLEERLIYNTVLSNDSFFNGEACWIWVGRSTLNRNGTRYGRINVYDANLKKVITKKAHRLSVEIFQKRPLIPEMVILHLCNNPMCVNPNHLRAGSQSENMKQCVAEKRHNSYRRK